MITFRPISLLSKIPENYWTTTPLNSESLHFFTKFQDITTPIDFVPYIYPIFCLEEEGVFDYPYLSLITTKQKYTDDGIDLFSFIDGERLAAFLRILLLIKIRDVVFNHCPELVNVVDYPNLPQDTFKQIFQETLGGFFYNSEPNQKIIKWQKEWLHAFSHKETGLVHDDFFNSYVERKGTTPENDPYHPGRWTKVSTYKTHLLERGVPKTQVDFLVPYLDTTTLLLSIYGTCWHDIKEYSTYSPQFNTIHLNNPMDAYLGLQDTKLLSNPVQEQDVFIQALIELLNLIPDWNGDPYGFPNTNTKAFVNNLIWDYNLSL